MSTRGTIVAALLALASATGITEAEVPSPKNTPPDTAKAAVPPSDPPPNSATGNARIVGLSSNKAGAPTLIGKSGELYEPTGDLEWKRAGAGGVSTDVVAIFRTPASGLFAVGSRAPLFRLQAGAWSSFHLGNRGRSAVSSGQLPIISVGRHIYELSKGRWQRIASARGAVSVLYAAAAKKIFVATVRGKLYVGAKSWRQLPLSLPAGDHIRTIVGLPNKHSVAVSAQHRLYLLTTKGAKLITLGAQYRGLIVDAIKAVDGKLLLAGRIGKGGDRKSLLAELGSKKLTTIDSLWAIGPDDRFAVIHSDHKKRLMVATETGQVRVRSQDGQWRIGEVDTAPPPPPEEFANLGPALAK